MPFNNSDNFNPHQYHDLKTRAYDPYADTKFQMIKDYLSDTKNLRILNAGCGSGELSILLAEHGHQVVGIDPSSEYITLAQAQLPRELAGRCIFQVQSIDEHETNELYQCVLATDVLEHIADDRGALEKLHRLTQSEGRVVITVPALPLLFGYHDESLGHFRRYTKKILRDRLVEAGFEVEHMWYIGFFLIPVSLLYSKFLRRPYPIEVRHEGFARARQRVFKTLMRFEQAVFVPWGTTLLAVARKN